MKLFPFSLFLVLAASLSACVSVPGTDKKAFIIMSRDQELQMGVTAYQDVLKKERISSNAKWTAMLKRVGGRIAAVAAVPDFQWEFTLIENPEKNAFALPGGKVAFYTGIYPVLQNEAAIAVVMGHEVAHAVQRHGAQRVSRVMVVQLGLTAFDAAVMQNSKNRDLIMGALGVGASVGAILPHSRENELDADTLGLRYAALAGYDPREGERFWTRFSAGGSKMPELLSTHPSDSHRIENMRRLAAEVLPVYEKSPKYGLGENI